MIFASCVKILVSNQQIKGYFLGRAIDVHTHTKKTKQTKPPGFRGGDSWFLLFRGFRCRRFTPEACSEQVTDTTSARQKKPNDSLAPPSGLLWNYGLTTCFRAGLYERLTQVCEAQQRLHSRTLRVNLKAQCVSWPWFIIVYNHLPIGRVCLE